MTPPTTQRRAESKSVSSPTASARFWTRLLIWHVFLNVSPEVGPAFTQKAFLLSQKKKKSTHGLLQMLLYGTVSDEKNVCVHLIFFVCEKLEKTTALPSRRENTREKKKPKISYKKKPQKPLDRRAAGVWHSRLCQEDHVLTFISGTLFFFKLMK